MRDIEYPTEKLKISDWDPRTEHKNKRKIAEAEKKYTELVASIKENGIRVPIMVVAKGNGYEVVGGRHRFRAAQELGLKTVPISIHEDAKTKTDRIVLAGIENYMRIDSEGKGLARWVTAMYEASGYTAEQAVQYTKAIDNWFSNNTDHKTDWDKLTQLSCVKSKHDPKTTNPILTDKNFVAICKRIGFAPKYQYQLISIALKLSESVIDKAEKLGLSTTKQIMLTTDPLPEHPKIQEELIDEIAEMSTDSARVRVQQIADELSIGKIRKDEETGLYIIDGKIQEEEDETILPPLNTRIIDINTSINKLLFNLTQRAITRGEHKFSEETIKDTREYRIEILKTLDERNTINLERGLRLIRLVTDEMLALIEREFESLKMKERMSGK